VLVCWQDGQIGHVASFTAYRSALRERVLQRLAAEDARRAEKRRQRIIRRQMRISGGSRGTVVGFVRSRECPSGVAPVKEGHSPF
jgi:hypothetical protein